MIYAAELPARYGLPWTRAEDNRLLALLDRHRGYREIALELGRPVQGVVERAQKYGATVRTVGGRTQSDVALLLGVCHSTVIRWRRKGWLIAHEAGGRTVIVEEEDLLAFLENPAAWPWWDPARIADPLIREWAAEIRTSGPRYLTPAQAAERLCVVPGAVNQAIRQGRLRAIGTARARLIREDWLAGGIQPGRRRRPVPAGYARRPEILEAVRRDWGRRPGSAIAAELGISSERVGSLAREELGLPALGRGYWRRASRDAGQGQTAST